MADKEPNQKPETLLAAVEAGDLPALRVLIKAGADLGECEEYSPLAQAAEMNRPDMVKELLKAGADPDFGGIWVPLCTAVRGKSIESLKLLIKAKAKVDAQEEEGDTALMYAAAMGDLPMVKLLIKAGADPELEDEDGKSAIIYGIGHPKIVEFLSPRSSAAALEYIEERARKLDAVTEEFLKAVGDGDIEKVRQMLADGMPAISINKEKQTALHVAISAGKPELIEFLLQAGVPINVGNQYGRTPLYEAAGSGNLALVEHLIQAGADVNIHDKVSGDTAFLTSVGPKRSDHAMMRLLAKHGADVKAVDDYGNGALYRAWRYLGWKQEPGPENSEGDEAALLVTLIETGVLHSEGDRLTAAAGAGDLSTVKRIIQSGVPVDTVDQEERTSLYMAISRQHPSLVAWLLQSGASVKKPVGWDKAEDTHWGGFARPCPKCGHVFTEILPARRCPACSLQFETNSTFGQSVDGPPMFVTWCNGHLPLMTAAKIGNPNIMKLLLGAGADPNLGKDTITPLMVACYFGHLDTARLLIAHGADPKKEGRTPDRPKDLVSPVGIAAKNQYIDLVKLLWESGVPAKDKNSTLLVDAARRNDVKTINQLLAGGADAGALDPLTDDLPLNAAAAAGNLEAVSALIAGGAPVEPGNARRFSPLMKLMLGIDDMARQKTWMPENVGRYVETVKLLLAAGARVNSNFYGMSPLSIAENAKCLPLVELFKPALEKEKAAAKKR